MNEYSEVVKECLGICYSECVEMAMFMQPLFPPGTERSVELAIYFVMCACGKCSNCMVNIQTRKRQLLKMQQYTSKQANQNTKFLVLFILNLGSIFHSSVSATHIHTFHGSSATQLPLLFVGGSVSHHSFFPS